MQKSIAIEKVLRVEIKNLNLYILCNVNKNCEINFPGAAKQSIWIISGMRTFGTPNKSFLPNEIVTF